MSKEVTCGHCPSLAKSRGTTQAICCKENGNIIPHRVNYKAGDVILWRVPLDCPRSDKEVAKSASQARKADWVTVKLDQIARA